MNLLETKILELLHHVLVDIRNQAHSSGDERIAELADAAEVIPQLLIRNDGDRESQARSVSNLFLAYDKKFSKCLRAYSSFLANSNSCVVTPSSP
jgi:hypothetical protein